MIVATDASPIALADGLAHVNTAWAQAVNKLVHEHPSGTCQVGTCTLSYSWHSPGPTLPNIQLHFSSQGHHWAMLLDTFASFDIRLVGEPFLCLPPPLRRLCIDKLLHEMCAPLSPALQADLHLVDVHWSPTPLPPAWHTLGLTLHNTQTGASTQAVFATNSADTLQWLLQSLPAATAKTYPLARETLLRQLRTPLRLNIGITHLRRDQIESLESHDLVWIETAHIAASGLACQLHPLAPSLQTSTTQPTLCGYLKHRQWRAAPDLHEHFQRHVTTLPTVLQAPIQEQTMSISTRALEIPVTFDLGEIQLTLEDIETFSAQQIIELPHEATASSVQLRVNGTCIAQGQLVIVGRRLAVRLEQVGISPAAEFA